MKPADKPRPLRWRALALRDRLSIFEYVAERNSQAALKLDLLIESKANMAGRRPTAFRTGRVAGTREVVVTSSYVIVYRVLPRAVEIVRVLHTARRWPPEG